jgi:hypothetical protein
MVNSRWDNEVNVTKIKKDYYFNKNSSCPMQIERVTRVRPQSSTQWQSPHHQHINEMREIYKHWSNFSNTNEMLKLKKHEKTKTLD